MAAGGGSGVPPDRSGPADAPDSPRIGVDEWVASVEGKRERYTGLRGGLMREWDRLPPPARVLVFAIPAAIFPLVTTEGNLFRYGLFTLIYALLALGLNIVVGFAGLLDLGYIAFFGCGAYLYAILASPQFGYHWQAEAAIPVIVLGTAIVGLLVGLPSRLVESGIALSVLLAALNNVWPQVTRRAWILAFAFGLVHGFGFASVLGDLGLPRDALAISLAGFNIGVEIGQLSVVLVVVPLIFVLRERRLYRPAILVGGSAAIAVVAAGWFVQRALGFGLG